MIVNTSIGPLEKDLIEHRIVRESEHDGNRAEEMHYFYENEPIFVSGVKGELNLYPKQLSLGGEQGKIG